MPWSVTQAASLDDISHYLSINEYQEQTTFIALPWSVSSNTVGGGVVGTRVNMKYRAGGTELH